MLRLLLMFRLSFEQSQWNTCHTKIHVRIIHIYVYVDILSEFNIACNNKGAYISVFYVDNKLCVVAHIYI